MLFLMDECGMSARDIESLIYKESGLLGVSGISSDMRALLESSDPRAGEAVELFMYRITRELGSLAAALGGLDALVFTGGIGENAPLFASGSAAMPVGWDLISTKGQTQGEGRASARRGAACGPGSYQLMRS